VGKEPALLHDMRLQLALSALKLKAWPFPGPIALRERDFRSTEMHIVDRWTYLGTARSDEDLAAICSRDSSAGFDVDVYRILVRYFAKHPKPDWIDLRGRTICT
jgi:DNA polymerase-3 subunit epsilon